MSSIKKNSRKNLKISEEIDNNRIRPAKVAYTHISLKYLQVDKIKDIGRQYTK